MGVFMQGPDYTQWHGSFEVGERFYFDFLLAALEASRRDPEAAAAARAILDSPEHAWKKGMSATDRACIDAPPRSGTGSSRSRRARAS